jgi:hypothetical protein
MKYFLFFSLMVCRFLEAKTNSAPLPQFTNVQNLQTASASTSTCIGSCDPFVDVVAFIILPNATSQQPLNLDETKTLRSAISDASTLGLKALAASEDLKARAVVDAQNAILALQKTENTIAAAHGWDSSTHSKMPYQITYQEATILSYLPAVWKKVAIQGQTIHLAKGTIVRYGAPAGTPRGYPADNLPLPTDSFLQPVTLTADTDITVGSGFLTSSDPAYGYIKELDIQVVTSGTADGMLQRTVF